MSLDSLPDQDNNYNANTESKRAAGGSVHFFNIEAIARSVTLNLNRASSIAFPTQLETGTYKGSRHGARRHCC
jgi:hypothetical protein